MPSRVPQGRTTSKIRLPSALKWGVLALVVVIVVELASLVAFRLLAGQWFSYSAVREMKELRAAGVTEAEIPAFGAAWGLTVLHPYLGFVYNPDWNTPKTTKWHRNEVTDRGFLDRDSDLKRRSPGKYIVGIFGGSVAYWLSVEEAFADACEERRPPWAGNSSSCAAPWVATSNRNS